MTYAKGARVALVSTTDERTDLKPDDEGTVTRYDATLAQLNIAWDNGSRLSMLLDDGDEVRPA
ncbi:DUF4314 domain-containing protein [Streptomyces sp. NPDC056463]|uniref:DUF4314 domain-containing protein n=1 Tax=Streptomyces sp. NPDC056463 TaxID=3345827 RepID=UPI00367D7D32